MDAAQTDPAIRFIVTFGHRPAYSSGHHEGDSTLKGHLDALGATHSKYVLNLNAHSHNYERSLPQNGVVHITAGTGGSNLEQDGSCLWLACTQPSWSAFRAMHLGSLKLHFTSTGIEGSFLCGPAGGGTNDVGCPLGSVLDTSSIGGSAPTVTAPSSASVAEASLLTVSVTATDPDGEAITSLTADLTGLPAGNNAQFSSPSPHTSGTFTWTTAYADARTAPYDVTFTAANVLSGSATTAITVTDVDRAPAVTAPATATVQAGSLLTVSVTASDPDGEAITSLTADLTGLPAENDAQLSSPTPHPSERFTWTPADGNARPAPYNVTFTAANALSGSATTAITVVPPNQNPTAVLTISPSTGNAPLFDTADASGSSDSDGSVVSYRFDFGDGTIVGPQASSTATHTYAAGNWTANVLVTDDRGGTATASVPVAVTCGVITGPNLVGNPSFETNTTGWSGNGGGTLQ